METRYLQTLLTVVETSSLAETARRLNITPSAVVQRIRALEDEIGQSLIHRSGHSMRPTVAGSAILPDVRRLLAVESEVKAATAADCETGLLRIGVIPTAVGGLLPDLLVTLQKNRPQLELYIAPGRSSELHAAVAEGNLDAAIQVQPQFTLPKTLDWRLLRREQMLLITPPAVTDSDPRGILEREPFIRYDRNHWGGRAVDQYLRKLKVRPQERYEIDSVAAITTAVGRGLGVALIPDWLPPWPLGTTVRRIRLAGVSARNIGILWSKSSSRLPLIRAFVTEAVSVARAKGYFSVS